MGALPPLLTSSTMRSSRDLDRVHTVVERFHRVNGLKPVSRNHTGIRFSEYL